MASSPRTLNRPTGTDQTPRYAKSPIAVHRRCACSGVKALRNTSPAKRQAAKLLLPFRSLDPFRALREPDRRRRDEEPLSRSEQRTDNNPKKRLDRKSPIQVRIRLSPAASLENANVWPSANWRLARQDRIILICVKQVTLRWRRKRVYLSVIARPIPIGWQSRADLCNMACRCVISLPTGRNGAVRSAYLQ